MNWEAIGAIAELLGALGVIVSLIYLAAQIRQSTRSACSASFQAAAAEAGQIYRVIAENSEAARVFRIGMQGPTKLDSDEMVRFVSLLASMFGGYENMFVQYQNRKVDEASCGTNGRHPSCWTVTFLAWTTLEVQGRSHI